jgi:hypothetical protein
MKYHHGGADSNHPGFDCKHNQPTQRQPDCADELDGSYVVRQRTPPPTLQYQPPIQQLTIPVQQPFTAAATGRLNPGSGGGGRGGRSRQGRGGHGGGHNQLTPFANFCCTQGVGSVGQGQSGGRFIPKAPGVFTPQAPAFVPPNAQNISVPFSNTLKSYTNWNVCYSCEFDVDDGHTSIT